MRIHVAARSKQSGEKFVLVNPGLRDVEVHLGADSLFDLLNDIIARTEDDYALFVHDDVFLPRAFQENAAELVQVLDREWPNWGICGNAGVGKLSFGLHADQVVRYLFDPHGGPSQLGGTVPVEFIDGNLVLLNCRMLRQRGVRLPNFSGFHLYDIALSVETICSGLAVVVSPLLACHHDSKGNQRDFDKAASSPAFRDYLSRRISNRSITTLNGICRLPLVRTADPRPDVVLTSLRNAARRRARKVVAIVIRSQFRAPSLLRRALETVAAFVASAGDGTQFVPFVITDAPEKVPDFVGRFAETIEVGPFDRPDTRNLIVRSAIERIDADYFWFLDDDDWLFPNEAELVSLAVSCAAVDGFIFVGTQHFKERFGDRREIAERSYRIEEARYFSAANWSESLKGANQIPFCGMIISRKRFADIPDEVFQRVTLYEDYALQLFAVLGPYSPPVALDRLVAGVSVRPASEDDSMANSITVADRSAWHQSSAELAAILCNSGLRSLAMGWSARPHVAAQQALSRTERRALALARRIRPIFIRLRSLGRSVRRRLGR